MVIIKTRTLSNFSRQKNDLLTLLVAKSAASKITTVNKNIDNKYRAEMGNVTDILNAIEAKFKKCEAIYYTYFEEPDYGVLSGNISTIPVEVDCELIDGTVTLKYFFSVNDRYAYKEIIDSNFQTFILTLASMYENIVLLAEIFLKKVIIYVRPPLSSPLVDYLGYLKLLISLGYRKNDKLNICMTISEPFFTQYLKQINHLRNSFIHGYSINLESDGFNYYVACMDLTKFNSKSANLLLNIFTKDILDNTRIFIGNLMMALEKSGKHHSKFIPA